MKISKVSKLDGIWSWSLPALATCPGARHSDGRVVDVCQRCYALQGHYHIPRVKAAREHNQQDWKRDDWVADMVAKLDTQRYFRWFDSGDIYHPRLALKILEVVRSTPWCHHWIPTRSYKIGRINKILEWIAAEPNAVVRYSSDEIDSIEVPGPHASIVVTSPNAAPQGVHVCPAYQHKPAKCNGCRACWDKNVATVAYPLHGRRVFKLTEEKAG